MKSNMVAGLLGSLIGLAAGYAAASQGVQSADCSHESQSATNTNTWYGDQSPHSIAQRAASDQRSSDVDAGTARAGNDDPVDSAERARRLVSQLSVRTADVESSLEHFPEATVETAVNMVSQYQSGWIDAVTSNPNTDYVAMREEFAGRLCDRDASDVQRATLLALTRRLPEVASNEGVDCVLEDQTEEGPMLWYAIDAHMGAQLQQSPAFRRWQESAADPRTTRRFEEFQGRDPEVMRSGAI